MELKNFEEFFRESSIPMWIYDPQDYSIREINESMVRLYGYTREQMLSFTLFNLRSTEEVSKLKEYLKTVDHDKFSEEGIWKHEKKNGEAIYVHVITNPVRFKEEDHTYQLAMYKDITQELDIQLSNDMLFKYSLDGIMLTKPNGDILQANPAACEILDMSEQEIIARGREGIVAKDEKLEAALDERSRKGGFYGELNFIHRSGRKIPVEVTSSIFRNYGGEKRTSLIFRDISRRKENELALRQEKEFTDVVLNNLPGLFYILNQEGQIVRFNEHATEVFGLAADEIIGRSAAEFVHESDKEKVFEYVSKVLEDGYQTFELKLNIVGGETATFRFNAERLEQQDRTLIIGAGINITKQKELQAQLNSLLEQEYAERKKAEAGRDRLKEMFEEAPSPKCMLEGPEMRFVIANKAYGQVVGKEQIIGKRIIDVIPEIKQQGYIDLLQEVYEKGEQYIGRAEPVYFAKDEKDAKQQYVFNFIYKPLFDENGEVYGIFVEAMDLSEQIAYQKKLKESLEEKETLLAEIHHRVKNNLAIITSMMELQALETEDTLLGKALRTAQQRIQTIATIHELLYGAESLSHLNFGENVKKLVRNLEDVYSTGQKITVNVDADPISMNINQAIPSALLVNEIVTNAYKHAFENQGQGVIDITVTEGDEKVKIVIKDNGIGMPADVMEESSTSIGLTLVKLLEQQLDGDVHFSNDNGTEFSLVFEKTKVKGIGSNLIEN